MTWRSIWSVQVKVWMFRSHQCMHSQAKTLDSQQSVKAVDGGHSCGIWAPWSIIKSSYVLGHHLKSRFPGTRVWNSSEVHSQVQNPRKSKLVNCGWFFGFDGWKWFEGAYSCPNRPHMSWQLTSWKNLKPIRKIPKIETGPVISTAKNRNFLILSLHHDTSSKWVFAQHGSWRSCLPIFKKSKNIKIPCVVVKIWSNHFHQILNFNKP
jgi:hypothetical protein